MNKQTREAIFLSVAILALIILAVYTFHGMSGSTATPKPAAPDANAAAQASSDTTQSPASTTSPTPATRASDNGKVTWLDETRLPELVGEVQGGRNPFMDLIVPTSSPTPTPTRRIANDGGTPDIPKTPNELPKLTLRKTLNWITPEALAAAFTAEKLKTVDMISGSRPNQVVIKGYEPEFSQAVEIINEKDVPPPIPHFILSGVIATPTQRLAVVLLDGKQYSLLEGESIPTLGWTATRITPTGVNLTKGKLSTELRLSGGSPS